MIHDVFPLVVEVLAAASIALLQLWQFLRTHPLARIALFLLCLLGFTANASAAPLWQTWQVAKTHDHEFKPASAVPAPTRETDHSHINVSLNGANE